MKRKPKSSEVAAIEDLKKKIRIARSKAQFELLAELYNLLGNQHRLLGNYEDALDAHQEEINISNKHTKHSKDKMGLGIAYRNMGEVLTEMKKETEAIKYIRKYLNIAVSQNNFVEQQRAYITLGRAFISMADTDGSEEDVVNSENQLNPKLAAEKAENSFRQAYKLLNEDELKDNVKEEKEFMLMKCNNCQNLGIALELLAKFDDAAKWFYKAIDIGSKYHFNENLAPCYAMLCGLLLKEKKWKEALSTAMNATKVAKALGNEELEVESQLCEARALFMNDEVDAGKKILKQLRKRIRKKKELHTFSEQLDPLLIAAVRVSRTLDEIHPADKTNAEKMKLHEKLGDNYVPLGNFERAILHYKKSCECAEKAGISGRTIAKLYFSIAETYCDLEDYPNALEYYRKEMAINSGNPSEEFKTQTNITVVLEKLRKSPDEVVEAHELAIAFARMTKSLIKEVTALNNFGLYLKSIGRGEDSVKQIKKASKIKTDNNLKDLEEPDSQDMFGEEEDDVDLNALSDEESEDEADDDKRCAKKSYPVRKNEVGESQLHVAAKKGEIKTVRKLIRLGHPVHIRDNAGWTPLHEACNYGHADVVEELLKGGAKVNDSGGALAEKVTPLHDAASNCHSEVMKVLLKYKADVLARDIEGKYAIECLMTWRDSGGKDCTDSELDGYKEVKKLMKELMAKAGKPYRTEDEQRARRKAHTTRSASPKMSLLVSKPRDYECPIPVKVFTDDYDPDEEGVGKKLYQTTIKQVRRKDMVGGAKCNARSISPGPTGALVPSERNVQNQTDWLLGDDEIDPIEPNTSRQTLKSKTKRKRDPMDDGVLKDRSTRRKTSGDGRGDRQQRNQRQATTSLDDKEDDSFELMDVESQTANPSSSRSHDHTTTDESNVLEFESEALASDEDFCALYENNFRLNIPEQEDFLPSQRPSRSTSEFGRTIDVPINERSDDEDDVVSISTKSRRANKHIPAKKVRPTITVSSDESDDNNHRPVFKTLDIRKYLHKSANSSDSDDVNRTRTEGHAGTRRRRTSSTSSASHNLNNHRIDNEVKHDVLRLKVHILDNSLLVPVDEKNRNESIDWLANECATRYLRSYGVKPLLTLQTKDGATLTGTDSISFVLEANEREIVGNVTGFDLPPLTERYSTACVKAALQVDPEIMSCLNICQSSNILNLDDVCLRGAISSVLMNALQRQNSLKVLILSGCSLFDSGLSELCKALPTLSGLTELDISSNGITNAGFTVFSNVFFQENRQTDTFSKLYSVPLGITSLVLSHNPLGNRIGTTLAALLDKLRALNRLEISDCDLTDKFFSLCKNELNSALNKSRLEELDISYNNFMDVGLEKCLQSLPARKMRSLNCSATCSSGSNDTVARAISTFLSGNEDCCNLKTLQLNDCGLNDKSLESIIDNFDRLVRLDNLELACNDDLTSLSLVNILKRSVDHEIPLSKVDLGSIPKLWDTNRVTDEMVLQALIHKLSSEKKLSLLRVPTTEMDSGSSGSQKRLSKLEQRTMEIMEDYAGNSNFHLEKIGACIIYNFED